MFKNKSTCLNCSNVIDALDVDCPYCHTHNNEYDKMHLSTRALNVRWYFQMIFFLVGWMGIQIIGTIVEYAFSLGSGVPLNEILNHVELISPIEFTIYGIEFVVMLVLLFVSKGYRHIPNSFKSYKTYLAAIVGFIIVFGISEFYGLFKSVFNDSNSNNESLIQTIVISYPVLSILFFGFIGPICEELTYRVGLFGLLRRWNRVAAYLIGAFVFAFIHFDISCLLSVIESHNLTPLVNELWNFPYYFIGAICLVTVYDNFGFGASTLMHITNNVFDIIMIILAHYVGK